MGRSERFGQAAAGFYRQGVQKGYQQGIAQADAMLEEILIGVMVENGVEEVFIPDEGVEGDFAVSAQSDDERGGLVYRLTEVATVPEVDDEEE